MSKSFIRTSFMVVIFFTLSGMTFASDNSKIAEGLKEALVVGVQNAVKKVGIDDGYFKNELIKIVLPDKFKQAEDYLAQVKMEKYTEDLVKKMNRAAEGAAPTATAIFVDSVKKMSFDDASKILSGKENAATEYLKGKSLESLKKAFYPKIKESMEKVNAIKVYNDFVEKYSSNPLLQNVNLDITDYVTDEALDGLFVMIAAEEKKIRNDPEARLSDLLKDVFGGMFK